MMTLLFIHFALGLTLSAILIHEEYERIGEINVGRVLYLLIFGVLFGTLALIYSLFRELFKLKFKKKIINK